MSASGFGKVTLLVGTVFALLVGTIDSVAAAANPVVAGSLVAVTATSSWSPASPDPSGVVWIPGSAELLVVDSEVDETTGAGWHGVNMWRTRLDGSVIGVGTFWGPQSANGGVSREPTGVGYASTTDTLFVSDDDARRVNVVKRGPDGNFGTADDVVTSFSTAPFGTSDTEDPEFLDGILYILDGANDEIYRVDPVDGTFGNGNDQMTHFDIGYLGPSDWEGLASDAAHHTLYVGARTTKEIYEVTTSGTLIRMIDLHGISGLSYISGLTVAPASNGSGALHFYSVDRKVDNDTQRSENDGRLFEIDAPGIGGGGGGNRAPVAVNDVATVSAGGSVTINVLANDSDPDGDALVVTALGAASSGVVVNNGNGTVTYTPGAGYSGPDSFTYRAFDGVASSNVATVNVTVTPTADTRPPETTIVSGPPSSTSSATASFSFVADEPATFECSLDGAGFTACSSPASYGGLAVAAHHFEVRARDLAGNRDATPASWDWTVTGSSSTSVTLLPAADAYVDEAHATSNYGSSTLLSSDGGNGQHEEILLRYDVSGLAGPARSAKLRVYVTNGTGNGPEVFPASNAWNEGTVTWNTRPARTGGAVFDAGSIPINAWYEFDVTPLITGNGSFTINLASVSTDAVRFHSREGSNRPVLVIDADSASDTSPPTVSSVVPADGAVAVSPSASVSATFSEPIDPATVGSGSFTLSNGIGAVSAAVSYDPGSRTATLVPGGALASGTTYTARITTGVRDVAGNPLAAPVAWSFTVSAAADTRPPETTIVSGPPSSTSSATASFSFVADEPATFECSLDGAGFTACSSPASYGGLAVAAHHFEVRARDLAGNRDATPASWDWTVTGSSTSASTFLAVADTYVNASRATTNYGASTTLISDGAPEIEEALLRFDVSGLGGSVRSAVLRIYVTNGSYNGPEVFMAANGWSELAVNWNNRPGRTTGAVADAPGIPAGGWFEFDVTAGVSGNGSFTFDLASVSSDALKFQSREVAGFEPQLVVTAG